MKKVIKIIELYKTTAYREKMSFDNFKINNQKQKEIVETIKKNIDDWFVFYGNVGTGKTHLATSIAKYKWENGCKNQKIVKFRNICLEVKNDFAEEINIIKHYSNYDLLIIEEIGRGYNSEFEVSVLFEIIDNRYENNKQTILTTNININDFIDFVGEATIDRLKEKATFISFDWESYRQIKNNTINL